jgi:hypothetical protein
MEQELYRSNDTLYTIYRKYKELTHMACLENTTCQLYSREAGRGGGVGGGSGSVFTGSSVSMAICNYQLRNTFTV